MTRVDLARLSDVSSGIPSGTSFPGSPATNDLFFRTDLGLFCYYDGTRWLTVQVYELPFAQQEAFPTYTANGNIGRLPVHNTYSMWLVGLYATTYVSSANSGNSGSHFWTLTLNRVNAANTATSIGTIVTSPDTADTWTQHTLAVNAALAAGALHFRLSAAKTGTPGDLHPEVVLAFRLIIT